jgi:multiple sugar transport system ATP-binding protein
MARLVVSNLSKVYRTQRGNAVTAVNALSFEVANGELLVLTGPSGSGKTTTLRLIAGLETPSDGTISMDGELINSLKPHERDVAMMFQSDALLPHLSAYDNIALGLKLRKVEKAEMRRRVEEAAELLEITALLNRMPGELSGGERRRVALGRAIVRRPKLFLLDEPFSNLDAPLRTRMRDLIARLHKQLAATMILVTHDPADALGDRTLSLPPGAP